MDAGKMFNECKDKAVKYWDDYISDLRGKGYDDKKIVDKLMIELSDGTLECIRKPLGKTEAYTIQIGIDSLILSLRKNELTIPCT